MSLFLALPGALAYGFADFAGGLATRRAPVLLVTAVVQLAGLVALLAVVPLAGGTPSWQAMGWGVLAAAGGTGGLLLYLRALAVGPMGLVAPLSAVVGAGLPLMVGLVGGERLGPVTLVAIGRKVPRTSSGASGFRSHMSSWDGPPDRNRMMTDFASPPRAGPEAGAAAVRWRRSRWGRVSPPSPMAPTRRWPCIVDMRPRYPN